MVLYSGMLWAEKNIRYVKQNLALITWQKTKRHRVPSTPEISSYPKESFQLLSCSLQIFRQTTLDTELPHPQHNAFMHTAHPLKQRPIPNIHKQQDKITINLAPT